MALDPKLLGNDEYEILHLRTHVKKLLGPAALLILTAGLLGAFLAWEPANWRPIGTYVVLGIALVVLVVWVLLPFLRWLTTTYTVTNRRIITRTGLLNRSGHDLPLRRVSNVNYERGLTDRILGCGTLILETAAEQPLVLPDIPKVENVHVEISEVLFGDMNPESNVHDD